MERKYIYLGDRLTDPKLKGQPCQAVINKRGKCIRGKSGTMLVKFESGEMAVVIGRQLRKIQA